MYEVRVTMRLTYVNFYPLIKPDKRQSLGVYLRYVYGMLISYNLCAILLGNNQFRIELNDLH